MAQIDAPKLSVTERFGFSEAERRLIARWWVDSGEPRWDKHADQDSLACTMECVEFVRQCVRGNLDALADEYHPPAPRLKAKVKRRTL